MVLNTDELVLAQVFINHIVHIVLPCQSVISDFK